MIADGDEPFVARSADLERLAAAYAEAVAGVGRVVMLSGEPGIGKTRLATHFARCTHDVGATVLYGRCDEDALLVLQPFVEALRHYLGACAPDDLAEQSPASWRSCNASFPSSRTASAICRSRWPATRRAHVRACSRP